MTSCLPVLRLYAVDFRAAALLIRRQGHVLSNITVMLNGEHDTRIDSEGTGLVARDSSGKIALFDWEPTSLKEKNLATCF